MLVVVFCFERIARKGLENGDFSKGSCLFGLRRRLFKNRHFLPDNVIANSGSGRLYHTASIVR